MKNMKKSVAILLAVVLLVGAAVGATIAWLTDETEQVTNTFTSAKLFEDPENDFTLWEHEAVDTDSDGVYKLNEEEVLANTYAILPGVDIPKDPTVDVVELLENGYLYIEVASDLPAGLTYEIDLANWEELGSEYPGVWVYKGEKATNNVIKAHGDPQTFTVNILEGKTVCVAADYAGTANGETLQFVAYMVQAAGNGDNAAEAWANTYGATP